MRVAYIAIVLGIISLVVGVISRFTMLPIAIVRGGGLQAQAMLAFAQTCFVLAIAFILLEIAKGKK